LPAASSTAVKESGAAVGAAKGVTFLKYENGLAVYSLKSGSYEFTSNR
jgi:alpha-L-rhamnosidase